MNSESDGFSMADAVAQMARSTLLYPQKLDLYQQALLFVRMEEPDYRTASFLDDRILGPQTQGVWILLKQLSASLAGVTAGKPLHFIFHSGHVGSTLMSRLLDATGKVFGLREPLPLRTLAEAHDLLQRPESLLSASEFDAIEDILLRLWARAPAAADAVVVKATSSAARLGAHLLSRRPAARAVHLNLRLESYLAAVLAGANTPIDLRGQAQERVRRLQQQDVLMPKPLHALTPGELAAMSWLAERMTQRQLQLTAGTRVLSIDFEHFLANLHETLAAVLAHLGVSAGDDIAARALRGPVLQQYSKASDHPYSAATRAQIISDSRVTNSLEIAQGLRWAEQLGGRYPLLAELLTS